MPSNLLSSRRATSEASSAHGATSPELPAGRPAVVVLVVTALFVLTQLYASIPLLGPVSADLGGDATFSLSTSFSLCYAAGFLVWGPVSDRYGRKRVMSAATGVLAVATLACATAPSAPVLAVLRGLQGLSASGFAPVALAYLTEAVPPARRAGAIGAMSTSFLVAGIFGQVLASAVALQAGWPWFFVLCAVILALSLVLVRALVAEPPQRASSASLLHQFTNLARLLATPAVIVLSVAHITLLMSFVALYTGIGQHLENLGVAASSIILIRLAALPAMLVSLGGGSLARRTGTARVAQTGFALAAVGMLGEAVASGTLLGLVVASIVYVAGVALAVPSMIRLYGEAAAPSRGSGMAINGFVLFIGASIGPVLGRTVTSLSALALVMVALLVVAAAAVSGFSALSREAGMP